MEKVMKKAAVSLDMENVEKLLIKNLENKRNKKNNSNINQDIQNEKAINIEDFSKEVIDFNKSFPEDNQIVFNFDKKFSKEDVDKINAFNSNKSSHFKHSMKMYNEKIGEYNYNYYDHKKSNKDNKNNNANSNNQSESGIFITLNFN